MTPTPTEQRDNQDMTEDRKTAARANMRRTLKEAEETFASRDQRRAERLAAEKSAPEAAVYRHWDKDGDLLYVGLAKDPLNRNVGYLNDVVNRAQIASITFEWFKTREEASAAESRAIIEEKPRYNVRDRNEVQIKIHILADELEALDEMRGTRTRSFWIRKLINECR